MIIRKLRANEKYKAGLVSAVAFEFGTDYLKAKEEAEAMTPEQIEEADKAPVTDDNSFPSEKFNSVTWAALDDDDSTVFGSVSISNYTVNFDGNTALMGGVGGVSTLPPYRRNGAIRECMRAALKEMNENGFDFSFLYPFSRAYYRKFGYENGAYSRIWTLQFNSLKKYGTGGKIEMLLPGDDFSPLTEIYRKFYEKYNLACARHKYDGDLENSNLLEQRRYVYIWKNDSGEPRGFMIFRKEDGVMNCTTTFGFRGGFAFLDAEALTAMLDFAQTFAPHYHSIKFSVPDMLNIDAIINEGNNASCTLEYNGMARVVNVERVLGMCQCRGKGSINISVSDLMCPWNNGVWCIKYAPGIANEVCKTENAPDIELDINMFTSLICGISSAADIDFMPSVKVNNNFVNLRDIFYRKPCFVLNLF